MAERQEELWMSRKDRDRLKVLHEVRKQHITQVQSGERVAISPRWVRELLRRMKARGDRAVVHGLRGKASNRRLPEATKAGAVKLFAQQKQARQWHDYGPTLAAEELAEHGLKVGKETSRKWLLQAGLWKARRARVERAHVAPPPSTLGRAAAVGHQYARLAGRTRAAVVSDCHARRCHLAADRALRRSRFDGGEPGDVRQLCEDERTATGGVHRQSQSVSDGCQGSTHPQAPAEQPTQIDKRHAEPTAPAPIIPTFISVLLLHCF